jgi:hypothetical protein
MWATSAIFKKSPKENYHTLGENLVTLIPGSSFKDEIFDLRVFLG